MNYILISEYNVDLCKSLICSNIGTSYFASKHGFVGKIKEDKFWVTYVNSSTFVRYTPPKFIGVLKDSGQGTYIEGKMTAGSKFLELLLCIWFNLLGCIFFFSAIFDMVFKTSIISGGNPLLLVFLCPVACIGPIIFYRYTEKLRRNDREQLLNFLLKKLNAKSQDSR